MSDVTVNMRASGPGETVLPPEDAEAVAALDEALAQPAERRKTAVASVVARWPRFIDAWARLGDLAVDDIEAYAYRRIGYHRGLDKLRASGWRGSGYVRWRHQSNRGFLRALVGLRTSAAAIGEHDEVERIGQFIKQLDPELDVEGPVDEGGGT